MITSATANRFIRFLKAGNRSTSTLYDYGGTYKRFFDQYGSLTTDAVEEFLDGFSPGTRLKYRTQLLGLARFAKDQEVDWSQIPSPKVHIEPPTILRPDHSILIYRWLRARDRSRGTVLAPAYQLILHTGLRISELTGLTMDSLRTDRNGMPFLAVSKASGRSHSKDGRVIPLDRTARRLTARYGLPLRITERTFNRMLQRACRESRIRQTYSAHCLRKTCLSRWHDKGMDVRTIADIAGHTSTDTLLHYLDRSPESLRRKMVRALRGMEE